MTLRWIALALSTFFVVHSRADPADQAYLRALDQLRLQTCPKEIENEFDRLNKAYRAAGFYIPQNEDGSIDLAAVKTNLPLIEKKMAWINDQLRELKLAKKEKPSLSRRLSPHLKQLQFLINEALELKKEAALAEGTLQKSQEENLKKNSLKIHEKIRESFLLTLDEVPFLKSPFFPIDHFRNRQEYEVARTKASSEQKTIMLRRRILEDGARNPDQSGSDIYLRSLLDTIALELGAPKTPFLDNDLRYDLEQALRWISSSARRGYLEHIKRTETWLIRTQSELKFYNDLLSQDPKILQLVKDQESASQRLKAFVSEQKTKVYLFWLQFPDELIRTFVSELILLQEVGRATPINYRDREDILGVLWLRHQHETYSRLTSTDPILTALKEKNQKPNPWLNVLFRQGEFSFTLHFIPASKFIFCPDSSFEAKRTRLKNLTLIEDFFRSPSTRSSALRYFSRRSMIGRVDVAHIWPEYEMIPEKPGRRFQNTKHLEKKLNRKEFRYFYQFTDEKARRYHVIEIAPPRQGPPQTYVVDKLKCSKRPCGMKFYAYRDPHYFTFFRPTPKPNVAPNLKPNLESNVAPSPRPTTGGSLAVDQSGPNDSK